MAYDKENKKSLGAWDKKQKKVKPEHLNIYSRPKKNWSTSERNELIQENQEWTTYGCSLLMIMMMMTNGQTNQKLSTYT